MELVWKAISAVFIAGISSWITVQLSKNKFRTERWWEKKVQAYERIIEAFNNSKRFDAELMRAEELHREISEERSDELRNAARNARDEILKASDIGSFLLSENALKILAKYEAESENIPRQDTWYEHLDLSWSIDNRYMKEFIEEAKRDLKK